MKPFFDALNAAMSPADFHAIRRAAEALKLAAGAELAKVSPLDTPDSVSKLWDDLSDFLAGFDAEQEQPDPRISAGERMASAAREDA
jgi:hypothetical protein